MRVIFFLLVSLFFAVNSVGQEIDVLSTQAESLVAYYPFNGNADDKSGNENHGTVNGASLTTDRFGNENSAYFFDGDLDFIETNSTFDFPNRTISAWFYSNDIDPLDDETKIILVQDSFELENGAFIIANLGDDLVVQDGFGVSRFDFDGLSSNRWYHVAMVRESDSVKYYVDNLLVGKRLADNIGSTFNPNKYLVIGASRSKTMNFYHGKIDDIRIYNYALSESEIQELFLEDEQSESLVAYYPFNGDADDNSGNENHGIVDGATLTTDRFGNENSAYLFDGTSHINTQTSFDYQNRSISLWINPSSVESSNSQLQAIFSQDSDELVFGAFKIKLESEKIVFQESLSEIYTENLVNDKWYHLTMVRSESKVSAYLDGIYLGEKPIEVHGSRSNANLNLIIGASRVFDRKFIGKIDDIRIYNYALNDEEVEELFLENSDIDLGLQIPTDDLISFYPFEGSVEDKSENHNNGIISNLISAENRFGQPNSAFYFPREGGSVDVEYSDDFLIAGDLTISVWVKPRITELNYSTILGVQGDYDSEKEVENSLYSISFSNYPTGSFVQYSHEGRGGENTRLDFYEVPFLNDEWNHLLITRDAENKKIYLHKNGELIETQNYRNAPINGLNALLRIGDDHNDSPISYRQYNGLLDDIAIYDRILNQSEIDSLYNVGNFNLLIEPGTAVSEELSNEVPTRNALHQNYPNPFNPSTTISFQLTQNSNISLRVYDISGRLIHSILDGVFSAGVHTHQFDASNLASGVYFYVLSGRDFKEVKKFTLIK